jgi:hypothetical protein
MAGSPLVPNNIDTARFFAAGNTETGITATASGNQTTAYALTAQLSNITTCATNADSVSLPKIGTHAYSEYSGAAVGAVFVVANAGAATAQIFGTTPDTINSVATGTGVAIPAGKTASFYAITYSPTTNVGNWVMQLSA